MFKVVKAMLGGLLTNCTENVRGIGKLCIW